MKLKTEVRQGDDMVVPIAAGDEFEQFNAYAHDAAAAHALRLAICELPGSLRATVIADADSYLAAWGFGEG